MGGCMAPPETPPGEKAGTLVERVVLFDAARTIQDQWWHLPLRSTTEYRLSHIGGRLAIRAIGRNSASVLIRRVSFDPTSCPDIEWSWRVDAVQPDADIRVKDQEDVSASIFLLFGDPGFLSNPTPVPTLRYVWTNARVPKGAVIDNPYLPGIVRSIVVQSGEENLGTWVVEKRNILADYRRAFGAMPENDVEAVALFTDNDQTGQPVEAYYGSAQVACYSENFVEEVSDEFDE